MYRWKEGLWGEGEDRDGGWILGWRGAKWGGETMRALRERVRGIWVCVGGVEGWTYEEKAAASGLCIRQSSLTWVRES